MTLAVLGIQKPSLSSSDTSAGARQTRSPEVLRPFAAELEGRPEGHRQENPREGHLGPHPISHRAQCHVAPSLPWGSDVLAIIGHLSQAHTYLQIKDPVEDIVTRTGVGSNKPEFLNSEEHEKDAPRRGWICVAVAQGAVAGEALPPDQRRTGEGDTGTRRVAAPEEKRFSLASARSLLPSARKDTECEPGDPWR